MLYDVVRTEYIGIQIDAPRDPVYGANLKLCLVQESDD